MLATIEYNQPIQEQKQMDSDKLIVRSLDDQVREYILQKATQLDMSDPKQLKATAEVMNAFCHMVDVN